MELLFYLVGLKKKDKSLLFTEMALRGSIPLISLSIMEDVISIMGLSSSVLTSLNPNFAEQGISIIITEPLNLI